MSINTFPYFVRNGAGNSAWWYRELSKVMTERPGSVRGHESGVLS